MANQENERCARELEMLGSVKLLQKTYDAFRIVDPVRHKVIEYQDNRMREADLNCFHFWKEDKACDNCVALKAYQENDVFIKLEYHQDKVYMVLAVPVASGSADAEPEAGPDVEPRTLVMEFFKDVSKNMLVVRKDGAVEYDVQKIIANADQLLLEDPLTGVFNRRYINERLPADLLNNSLHKGSLSLIMADIDFFKKINDTYGHLAGDEILKEVAAVLVQGTRKGKDWVARYGGEEFLVCLPDTEKARAMEIAERMRRRIEGREFEFAGRQIRLTVSFGVHTLGPETETSLETIIGLADRNLYQAKHNGRNMVVGS